MKKEFIQVYYYFTTFREAKLSLFYVPLQNVFNVLKYSTLIGLQQQINYID